MKPQVSVGIAFNCIIQRVYLMRRVYFADFIFYSIINSFRIDVFFMISLHMYKSLNWAHSG